MDRHLFLRVIWVAGTRMIEQGTDGFSRGDLENGVATGVNMLTYVPLMTRRLSANLTWRRGSGKPFRGNGSHWMLRASIWWDEGRPVYLVSGSGCSRRSSGPTLRSKAHTPGRISRFCLPRPAHLPMEEKAWKDSRLLV